MWNIRTELLINEYNRAIADGWEEYVSGLAVQPELLERNICKNCCAHLDESKVFFKKVGLGIQFRAVCSGCGRRSDAIPHKTSAQEAGFEVLYFGKHRGKTINEVFDADPDYLDWIIRSCGNAKLVGLVTMFLRGVHAEKYTVQVSDIRAGSKNG